MGTGTSVGVKVKTKQKLLETELVIGKRKGLLIRSDFDLKHREAKHLAVEGLPVDHFFQEPFSALSFCMRIRGKILA